MIKFLLILSAIIPATILVAFSFFVIGKVLADPDDLFQTKELSMLVIALLGIAGYLGLGMLLLNKDTKKPKRVLLFLVCGVASFVLFNSTGGTRAWKWVLTMQEPGEWFILVWPTIVSLIFIFSICRKLFFVNTEKPEPLK